MGPAFCRRQSPATLLLWRLSRSTDWHRKQPDVKLCLPLRGPHREGRSEVPNFGTVPALPDTTQRLVPSLPTVSLTSTSTSAFIPHSTGYKHIRFHSKLKFQVRLLPQFKTSASPDIQHSTSLKLPCCGTSTAKLLKLLTTSDLIYRLWLQSTIPLSPARLPVTVNVPPESNLLFHVVQTSHESQFLYSLNQVTNHPTLISVTFRPSTFHF